MLSVSLGREIVKLASGMSAVVAVLFAVGLILVVTEYFQSTKGVAYGCGIAVIVTAIALRMVSGGSAGMLFIMLFAVAFVLFGTHLIMLALHKREWLLLSSGIADVENYSDGKYSFLVGLVGITTTPVAPSGHMSINDINFYVTARQHIDAGVEVTVKEVNGDKIVIEPLSEEENIRE